MISDTTNTNLDYLTETPVVDGQLVEQGVLNIALSFFDRVRGLYVLTTDTTVQSGKTYYTYSNGVYTAVSSPSGNPQSLGYYETSKEKEVVLFKNFLPLAKLYCCRIFDWSFQTVSKTYNSDDIANSEEIEDITNIETGTYVEENDDETYTGYKMYKDFKYAFKLPTNFVKAKYINGQQNIGFAVKGQYIYCNSKAPTLDYITKELTNIPEDFGYLIAYRVAVEIAEYIDPEGTGAQRAGSMFSLQLQALQSNEAFNYRLENPKSNYFVDPDSAYWKHNGVVVR